MTNASEITPHFKSLNFKCWITPHFKSLIKQRQKALANGDAALFKVLRNRVNRERKHSKVSHLKKSKPKQWWKQVKSLCGMDPISPSNDLRLLLNNDENILSPGDRFTNLANRINQAFLTPMASFLPLPSPHVSCPPIEAVIFEDVTTENSGFLQLSHLKSSKAPGPDGLPTWIFKENADVLAKPVSDIFNASFRERCLPVSWKMADVTPLPKQKPRSTDGNGSLVRMAFLDFRKAFDLIDHHILVGKLQTLDLPCWVVAWVTNFLTDRQQRVKLEVFLVGLLFLRSPSRN